MRVLIVDDERRARERLSRLLAAFPDLEIAGEAENGLAALEAIESLSPDAVFLDVQMPGLDGFEVLKELPPDRRPLIVFATAFDQYALNAFEVSAVDYLMKPIEEDRLQRAVERLRERCGRKAQPAAAVTFGSEVEKLLAHLAANGAAAACPNRYLQRITAKRLQKYHVLAIESIEAFEAEDELVFASGRAGRFLVNSTLRDLEARLDPAMFARVHKQTIANLTKIAELAPVVKGGATARMESGATLEISRRYAPSLRDRLGW